MFFLLILRILYLPVFFFFPFFLLIDVNAYRRFAIYELVSSSSLNHVEKKNKHFSFLLHKTKRNGKEKNVYFSYKFRLAESLNDYIYKTLIKRFKGKTRRNTDTDTDTGTDTERDTNEKKIHIYKNLQSPKSSYTIDLLFSCKYTISDIKKKILEYTYELKLINVTNINVLYLGKRRLVRPIRKEEEAYYILFSMHVYPSLIKEIYDKLMQQVEVLRFIITKNRPETKQLQFSENDEHVKKWIEKTEESFFKKKL